VLGLPSIDLPVLLNVVCIISLWIFAFCVSGRVCSRTQNLNLVCINSHVIFLFLQFGFGFVDLCSWCVWFALSVGVIYIITYFGCIFLLLLSQDFLSPQSFVLFFLF
jgi:hypothetical protein